MKHRAKVFPRAGVRVTFNENIVQALRTIRTEVAEKVLRSAAHGGAQSLYLTMKANVPGKDSPESTGTLYASIYHWYDKNGSQPTHKIYYIGPNKKKASHWYNVEYGHWRYNKSINRRWQRSKSNRNARGPGAHDLPGALEVPVWVPAHSYIRKTMTSMDEAMRKALEHAQRRWEEETSGLAATAP